MVQFLVDDLSNQSTITVEGSEAKHIRDVFRKSTGDTIRLFDGNGKVAKGCISKLDKTKVTVSNLEAIQPTTSKKYHITLAQSLIPHDKMDDIILKATELGADCIQAFQSQRSIVKLSKLKQQQKIKRWQKIVLSGCKQCDRFEIPLIKPIVSFKSLMKEFVQYDHVIIAHPLQANSWSMKDITKKGSLLIVVGPEGGFDDLEIKEFLSNGARVISLGQSILRSETASQYLLSIIRHQANDR